MIKYQVVRWCWNNLGGLGQPPYYTGTNPFFSNNDNERFIRLVTYDHIIDMDAGIRKLYDSHIGLPGLPRSNNAVPDFGGAGFRLIMKVGDEVGLLNHIRVPINFTEWYFIVATYNPLIYDLTGNGYEGSTRILDWQC